MSYTSLHIYMENYVYLIIAAAIVTTQHPYRKLLVNKA